MYTNLKYENLTQIVDSKYPNVVKSEMKNEFGKLKMIRNVELEEVADMLKFFCDTSHRNWPLKDILDATREIFAGINWRTVYDYATEGNKKLANVNYLKTLVDCWETTSSSTTIPFDIFFTKAGSLSQSNAGNFYKIVVENSTGNINLSGNIFLTKLISKDEFKIKHKKTVEFDCNANCLELHANIKSQRELVELLRVKHPEYLLLGIFSVVSPQAFYDGRKTDEDDAFLIETGLSLLKTFFEGTTNHFIIYIIFERYKEHILFLLEKIDLNLTKTLDILLEHKKLNLVTNTMMPYEFCYDLIILCSRRDHLNLEYWTINNIKNYNKFVEYFYQRVMKTGKDKLFPFNKATIHTITKAIDSSDAGRMELNEANKAKLDQIRTLAVDGVQTADRATLFLSEIIQSNMKVEATTNKLEQLIKSEDASMGKNVFNLLIENYSGLFKLANSEMIASFFGELIRKKIGQYAFIKTAIGMLKKSLMSPSCDREYTFAFKVIEVFYGNDPEIFADLESLENVKSGLIKKDLIIVDEEPEEIVELEKIIESITKAELKQMNIDRIVEHMRKEVMTFNKIIYTSRNCVAAENVRVCSLYARNVILAAIFSVLAKESSLVVEFVQCQNEDFFDAFTASAFEMVTRMGLISFSDDVTYSCNLGDVLGRLILARNRLLLFDRFDAKNYILRSIEYRRISTSIGFISKFIQQGKEGLVYQPNNPWVIGVLELLNELYFCTLKGVRGNIRETFSRFGLELESGRAKQLKMNLVNYNFGALGELDGAADLRTLKKVVSTALNFSTRETATKVLKSGIAVTFEIAKSMYATVCYEERTAGNEQGLFTNIVINTLKAMLYLTTFEVLKNAMYSNLLHFFKLSLNTLPEDVAMKLINDNIDMCTELIEKVAITRAGEQAEREFAEFSGSLKKSDSFTLRIRRFLDSAADSEGFQLLNSQKSETGKIAALTNPIQFQEKKSLRKIENNEYQEIKSHLIQLGRKIPLKKTNYIFEEFPALLGPEKHANFKRLFHYIETKSPTRDEDCVNLSKYLVGQAIKTDCADEFVFEFLYKIFIISNKTKKETVNWLIYADDESRNTRLVTKFIQYNFIFIEEYDQALSKFIQKEKGTEYLTFSLHLLDQILFGPKVLCSIYNFIYTIEAISKKADYHTECLEFLKKIEVAMLDFNVTEDRNIFDDFVNQLGFLQSTTDLYAKFREAYRTEPLNFNAAFKSSWNHFVLYSGNYRYFKIDILALLVNKGGLKHIHQSLEFLIQAYRKNMPLFNMFYCRFLTKWLETIPVEDTRGVRVVVFKILEIICPTNYPGFGAQFIEVVSQPFFDSCADNESMWIACELFETLRHCEKYEKMLYDYFVTKEMFVKKYSVQLIQSVPAYCVRLKNLFGGFIKGNTALGTDVNVTGLRSVDFCGIHMDSFRANLKANPSKMCLYVLCRYHSTNPPDSVKRAYEEISKSHKQVVNEYEEKYFK
ncbi:general negative regulator of transcription sub 1 [Enterospora canceri]|uniref:General negative regulator of transcription sub 1 n=1 Tax=Enterospora canceri TaxID=1081671 RepID=A0A1Y1S9L3_9MICR|nr:general negative regulator of transcription sub 1 [Enterospora canceri]